MKHAKYQFLNGLALKIIAIITMSIDHIGQMFMYYGNLNFDDPQFWHTPLSASGYIMCCIGRLALPIFAILFAEGMRHSHDPGKYVARLGLMAALIFVGEIVIRYVFNVAFDNMFLTFVCAGAFILLVKRKDNYKYLCVLPIAIVGLGFAANLYTCLTSGQLLWWPAYLRPQYDLYGFLLMVLSYFAYQIADQRVLTLAKAHKTNLKLEELRQSAYYRTFTNLMWVLILAIVTIFFWLLSFKVDLYTMRIQSYALVTIIPIMLYNGNKGYSNKVVQYGFYLYYPLHIGIIFLGCFLGFGYLPGVSL